jgi:hypothetical protein
MGRFLWLCSIASIMFALASCTARNKTITQDELLHRTQQIMDATARGDRVPFEKYFADDSLIFDEKGRSMDKKAFVADQSPLPPGYSGSIKVINPQSRFLKDTAILSYDLDETETVFGQKMTARYHGTDTWVQRHGKWQIIAEQMLRYYEDPAPGKADVKKYPDYVGTYELAPETTLVISSEGNDLFLERPGRPKALLIPESSDIFFRKSVEGRQLFRRNDQGKVDAFISRRNNEDIVWKKIK